MLMSFTILDVRWANLFRTS